MILGMSIDISRYCRILKVINEKLMLHSGWTLKIADILVYCFIDIRVLFWIEELERQECEMIIADCKYTKNRWEVTHLGVSQFILLLDYCRSE